MSKNPKVNTTTTLGTMSSGIISPMDYASLYPTTFRKEALEKAMNEYKRKNRNESIDKLLNEDNNENGRDDSGLS